MKNFLLGSVALIALGATAPAFAADLAARPYTKAPAYAPSPIYNWTGFYIGGHVGGAFNGSNGFGGANNNDGDNARFLGGVQAGYDYQFSPNWVLGIEGQYSFVDRSNNNTTFGGTGYSYNNDERGLGSVTGRLGYTWGPALLYAKGGYAWADRRENLYLNGAGVGFSMNNNHRDGYTVGAGLEYMFTQNWSGKVEYQYYDFGRASFNTPGALAGFGSRRYDENTVKVGLNYRFNWGGPVVARY